MNQTKQIAIERFGEACVEEAESYYETDFDKEFWRDLTDSERWDYLCRAKYNLERRVIEYQI